MAPGSRAFADTSAERALALAYAARLMQTKFDESANIATTGGEFIALATAIYDWLAGPATLFITFGPILKQGTREPTGREPGGSPMQLHDDEEVDGTVDLASAKGNEVPDAPGTQDDITWTVEGDEGVIEIAVSADSRTVTVRALDLGTATLRGAFGDNLFITESFDVIPGDAVAMNVSFGAPRKQAAPEPEEPVDV